MGPKRPGDKGGGPPRRGAARGAAGTLGGWRAEGPEGYTHTYIHIYYIYIHIPIYVYVHTYVYIYIYKGIDLFIVCTYIYIHVCVHVYVLCVIIHI